MLAAGGSDDEHREVTRHPGSIYADAPGRALSGETRVAVRSRVCSAASTRDQRGVRLAGLDDRHLDLRWGRIGLELCLAALELGERMPPTVLEVRTLVDPDEIDERTP